MWEPFYASRYHHTSSASSHPNPNLEASVWLLLFLFGFSWILGWPRTCHVAEDDEHPILLCARITGVGATSIFILGWGLCAC